MKKRVLFIMALLASFVLVACQDTEPSYTHGYGVSYGLVHGHYVGVSEVVVNLNDEVMSVKFDEYFLPYSFAAVVVEDTENLPTDVLPVVGSRGTTYYAEYVSINGTIFTGAVSGDSGSQMITYSTPGVANIEDWVKVEANAKIYVDSVKADKVFIANQDGTKSNYEMSNTNAKLGWTKSSTGYWTNPSSYALGWGGNMKAITDSLVGTKLHATEDQIISNSTWEVDGLVTGATLVDFIDYYKVIQQAYINALATKI